MPHDPLGSGVMKHNLNFPGSQSAKWCGNGGAEVLSEPDEVGLVDIVCHCCWELDSCPTHELVPIGPVAKELLRVKP